MSRLRLIHWKTDEAEGLAAKLSAAGHDVDHRPFDRTSLRELSDDPPDALVIDLSRLPMQGRDVGIAVRQARGSRQVPLVFAAGEPQKVARVRESFPDAVFTDWRRIRSAIRRATARPPTDVVAPDSVFAGYAGRPLPGKLGIAAGCSVALVGAPPGFEDLLGRLPRDVSTRRRAVGKTDLTLWFVRSRAELERRVARMRPRAEAGGLWIAWPKKTSGTKSDLTQAVVRRVAMDSGLVDFKICSIDPTWSGLRFTRRDRS